MSNQVMRNEGINFFICVRSRQRSVSFYASFLSAASGLLATGTRGRQPRLDSFYASANSRKVFRGAAFRQPDQNLSLKYMVILILSRLYFNF